MRDPIVLCSLLLCLAPCCGGEIPSGSPDAGPCPACLAREVCDPVAGRCVTGLEEGAPCEGLADGGTPAALCGAGMVCGMCSGGVMRCSFDCTARTSYEVCGPDRACFARPGSTSAGFCGLLDYEGEDCDSSRLVFCAGSLSCITPVAGVTAGRCFASCVPGQGQCAAGRSCADPFPQAPQAGFCVVPPGPYPSRCDHSTLAFCGEGEQCVRPALESWGYCHRRCGWEADCPGASCVRPLPEVAFCATAAARCPAGAAPATCESCSGELDAYCAPVDVCVQSAGATVCKQRCNDDPAACPEGTTCLELQGSVDKACL